MKSAIFLILSILSSMACSAEFENGENLITPYEMDSGQWEITQKVQGSFKSLMWKHKEKGMADAYVVRVHHGNDSALSKIRNSLDSPGQKQCDSFESTDLEPIPNKNYESLIWHTECLKGADFKAQTLQLTIKGRDSNYLVQKIWRGEVPEHEMKTWIGAFRKIYVCDTRSNDKPCPSGYQKVPHE